MLPLDEQIRINKTITVQMLEKGTIDPADFDTILIHAIAGKLPRCLAKLALSVIGANPRKLDVLAEQIIVFRSFQTDKPIFPEEPLASGMLRLAQFKLAAAFGDAKKVSDVTAALFNEISAIREDEPRRMMEAMALVSVLCTIGIANYLDNWVALLHNLKAKFETNEILQSLVSDANRGNSVADTRFLGGLFSVGSAHIATVERLEGIINELENVDASVRTDWLTPIDKESSDFALLVNGPWVTQRHSEDFDAADGALRYQRMAEKTRYWGIRPLTLQCVVGQAALLDEYQNNKEGALAVLNEAVETLGEDIILSRAIAQVYWRCGDYRRALDVLRGIADRVGGHNLIERAFALREAAISAAKCDDWSQAEKWFLDAQTAARKARGDNMDVMEIGLGVDAAMAALETGGLSRALSLLAKAIEALADIDPKATLRAAYCHRVIRHTVLWAYSRTTEQDVRVDGQPIAMEAGSCSNPDPNPAILDLPLGHIDIAWYLLAEAEVTSFQNVGISSTLDERLAQGVILVQEFSLRQKMIQNDIVQLDSSGFSSHFTRYIESKVCLSKKENRIRETFNPVAPPRVQIPKLDKRGPFDSAAEQAATNAILAYGIHSALAGHPQPESMMNLESALNRQFSGPFPGKPLFDLWNEKSDLLAELDKRIVEILKVLFKNEHLEPLYFWMAGLHIFEWINQSSFGPFLTPRLAAWLRAGWNRILRVEMFRLCSPRQTVPPVKDILAITANDQSFIANLFLSTSSAVEAKLGSTYRDSLKAMIKETFPPSGNS